MSNLLELLQKYIAETLAIQVDLQKWEGEGQLPLFLRELYEFYEISIMNRPVLLMVDRGEVEQSPANVRKQMLQVKAKSEKPTIYVSEMVPTYNRKRLIEQHVSFVVPGKQMYLPPLGIDLRDLRESSRHLRLLPTEKLNPASQAVVLWILLNGQSGGEWTPSRLAKLIGYYPVVTESGRYSVMTISRAFDELESFGIGEVVKKGRERQYITQGKRDLWERAKNFMRTPVRKRIFIEPPKQLNEALPAGLSALSHYTMLAPPPIPVYAVFSADWQAAKLIKAIKEVPVRQRGCWEIEIWNYSPLLFQGAETGVPEVVDPFSLYISLKENPEADADDERVQLAMEKMMEKALW